MERIIAGRFETKDIADAAGARITKFVPGNDICIFYNNPPGQQGLKVGGGDESVDSSAHGAGEMTAGAAAIGGVVGGAIGALGGPVVALAAAGTGAYVGSLAGALAGLAGDETRPAPRHGGVFLAVRIASSDCEKGVINALQMQGAADIEEAEGEWRDGHWIDFDPTASPRLVHAAAT